MATVHQLIGARIREARKLSGVRQEELAERLGLTRTSISNYERGKQNLTIESLYALCGVLVFQPAFALFIGVTHLLIDTRVPLIWWRKFYRQTTEGVFAIHVAIWEDQVAHIAIIALAAWLQTQGL